MDVYRWLKGKDIIKPELTYTQVVAEGYVE